MCIRADAFISVGTDSFILAETCSEVTWSWTSKIRQSCKEEFQFSPVLSHTLARFSLRYAQSPWGCTISHFSCLIQQDTNFGAGSKTIIIRWICPQWEDRSVCFLRGAHLGLTGVVCVNTLEGRGSTMPCKWSRTIDFDLIFILIFCIGSFLGYSVLSSI